MNSTLKLTASVCIPTYQREADLIETIEAAIKAQPLEIIVVDQTHDHDTTTIIRLNNFVDENKVTRTWFSRYGVIVTAKEKYVNDD